MHQKVSKLEVLCHPTAATSTSAAVFCKNVKLSTDDLDVM